MRREEEGDGGMGSRGEGAEMGSWRARVEEVKNGCKASLDSSLVMALVASPKWDELY